MLRSVTNVLYSLRERVCVVCVVCVRVRIQCACHAVASSSAWSYDVVCGVSKLRHTAGTVHVLLRWTNNDSQGRSSDHRTKKLPWTCTCSGESATRIHHQAQWSSGTSVAFSIRVKTTLCLLDVCTLLRSLAPCNSLLALPHHRMPLRDLPEQV